MAKPFAILVVPADAIIALLARLSFPKITSERIGDGYLRSTDLSSIAQADATFYGIFHAAGPGHGKPVISSYLVANNETWRRGIVDDPTFANLAKFFTPQEIVEITQTVSTYYATGLVTKALKIEVETDGRLTVAGKC